MPLPVVAPVVDEDRSYPTRADLSAAIKASLVGQDLDKMTLKKLRRAVVSHMDLGGQWLQRALRGSRRDEFKQLATDAVNEAQANLPAPPPAKPEWYDMEDEDVASQVYLVTFAHILADTLKKAAASGKPIKDLENVVKKEIADAMIDVLNNPATSRANGGRPSVEAASIMKMIVVEEIVVEGDEEIVVEGDPKHFHAAVKISRERSFMPFKDSLRERHGLASHWSCSHRHFWSAARYLTFTTDKKRAIDPKPFSWTPDDTKSGEALDVYEESQEPYCAEICRKRREKAEMNAHASDEPDGKRCKTMSQHRFNKSDFTDVVLSKDLKTPSAVMDYLHGHGSQAARAFAQKNQRRLQEFIEDAEEWAEAPRRAKNERRTDWDIFCEVANEACPTGVSCIYSAAAKSFFQAHAPSFSQARLAVALRGIIINGPSKDWRVPFLIGSTNTGKSTVVESIESVFGEESIFYLPAETDNEGGALRGWLKSKRFVFWDEFNPVKFIEKGVLELSQFLKAFNGQKFEIQMNQRSHDGNKPFKWSRGAVFIGKEKGLWEPSDNVSLEDISHIQSRVDVFRCVGQIQRRKGGVPQCRCCFARWVCQCAAQYDANQALAAPTIKSGVVRGLASLLGASKIPAQVSKLIVVDVEALGAVDVQELRSGDWTSLPSWSQLREMEKRRLLAAIG